MPYKASKLLLCGHNDAVVKIVCNKTRLGSLSLYAFVSNILQPNYNTKNESWHSLQFLSINVHAYFLVHQKSEMFIVIGLHVFITLLVL